MVGSVDLLWDSAAGIAQALAKFSEEL